MRLLHTSDWHLGTQIEKASCKEEQQYFLTWLTDTMATRETNVLVVAGDLFHYASPSNTAERMYYDFLVDCTELEALQQVVIVGGNHDSPSGLEAPRNVLKDLDVTVVGDIPRDEQLRRERCLCPVPDGDDPDAVVAAIPYVRNSRLGLSVRGLPPEEIYERYVESFRQLYADLAATARKQWKDVPLIATGHLTAYASPDEWNEEDFETDIHACSSGPTIESIGQVDALPPDVFEDYDYAALGHIHRRMQVGSSPVHYSGSPVPTRVGEANVARHVLDVCWHEQEDTSVSVESLKVPTWRDIRKLTGPSDEVIKQIEAMDDYKETLPPYLYLEVELGNDETPQEPIERARDLLDEQFDGETIPPRIVHYSFSDPSMPDDAWRDDEGPDLQELDPMDVFERKYTQANGSDAEPGERLRNAFRQLVNEVQDNQREET